MLVGVPSAGQQETKDPEHRPMSQEEPQEAETQVGETMVEVEETAMLDLVEVLEGHLAVVHHLHQTAAAEAQVEADSISAAITGVIAAIGMILIVMEGTKVIMRTTCLTTCGSVTTPMKTSTRALICVRNYAARVRI